MNKSILTLSVIALLCVSCKKEQDPFMVSKQNIGLLTDSTQVKDLDRIFIADSIVKHIKGDEFTGTTNDIDIYEKGGQKLLSLTPSQALDSTATIRSIHIIDSRYKTSKAISVLSTFKDIREAYQISSIINSISTVIISVDEINATFTIDKKELPENLRYDMNLNIEAFQIPDSAKVKYFMTFWN